MDPFSRRIYPMPASISQPTSVDSAAATSLGAVKPARTDLTHAPEQLSVDPALFFNRELSWLAFNERVLNEAAGGWPLLDRLKFLSIFFSNLDEFFMIRVSALHQQAAVGEI